MISSTKVTEIFEDSLFKQEEVVNGKPIVEPIKADGITCTIGFHPERLNNHKKEIEELLDELPKEFKDGWSFLNLCQTNKWNTWTGNHQVCEQLMVLSLAVNKMSYCFPKEMWPILPGGVPYIQII